MSTARLRSTTDRILSSFRVEHVGGGCTVLRRDLQDGTTVVLTDGNQGHDIGRYADHGVDAAVLLFAAGDWDRGETEPVIARYAPTADMIVTELYDVAPELFSARTFGSVGVTLQCDPTTAAKLLAALQDARTTGAPIRIGVGVATYDAQAVDVTQPRLAVDYRPAGMRA